MDRPIVVDGQEFTLGTIFEKMQQANNPARDEQSRMDYRNELSALQIYSQLAQAAAWASIAQSMEQIAKSMEPPVITNNIVLPEVPAERV